MVNVSFSQEIKSIYKFEKEQKTKKFTHTEFDSLVLFSNGSFYRKYFKQFHEIEYSELKGNWKIENQVLCLSITGEKASSTEKKWTEFTGKFKYTIKRKKLIPINDSMEIYATHNLKLFE